MEQQARPGGTWLDDLAALLARLEQHEAPEPYEVNVRHRVVTFYTHSVADMRATRRAVGTCAKEGNHSGLILVGQAGCLRVEIHELSGQVCRRVKVDTKTVTQNVYETHCAPSLLALETVA